MSPEKSKAGVEYSPGPKHRSVPKILHRRISLARLVFSTLAACFVFSSIIAIAQEDRPEITPLERKLQKKKDNGPRAVALLQMSDKGKSSLIPVAILINGKFWDASSYKADPVPMALDPGTIYEAEQSGDSLGLFTIGSALHSNAANAPTPWLGTGTWRENGMQAPTKGLKAATVPVGMEDTDAPPRLTRESKKSSSTAPTSTTAPAKTDNPAPTEPPSKPTSSGDSDGPPRLTRSTPPPSAEPNSTQPAPSSPQTTSGSSKPADSKTGDQKSAQPKPDAQSKIPSSDSGTPEADRPILRRGKPAESFADEDIPGYSKPGRIASASAGKVADTASPLSNIKLIPAISDAGGPPPHSYAFEWLKGEEGDRQKQMIQMAKDQLHAYLATLKKETIAPKSAHSAPSRRSPKPAEPIFENVKMVAYDLWNSNIPIVVLSATAHMPPAAGVPHSEIESDQRYSILLVAYPDIYQNLHKLYAGVTDRFHLDVTPRLDLIDAVDADGDGQGELLFRETSDSGTGWVIYRATADKLWKMYDSLSLQ